MKTNHEVKVGAEGRVLIPADVRRAAGIQPGASVIVRAQGDEVTIVPVSVIKWRLQAMFADIEGSMAEALMAERREEAKRDAAAP